MRKGDEGIKLASNALAWNGGSNEFEQSGSLEDNESAGAKGSLKLPNVIAEPIQRSR